MTAITIPPKAPAESSSPATAATVTTKTTRKASRGRKSPHPNSILDRRVLQQALDDRGIYIKPMHIEGFYQLLHRQHYPDLPDFVEQYERYNEEAEQRRNGQQHDGAFSFTDNHYMSDLPNAAPLKNALTRKKNKNKMQLPNALLNFLKDPNNGLVTVTSKVAVEKTSADGTTTKLAIQLHDGQQVESVLMRYISHGGSRASLCVSSQCGCAMGCTFCATGTMGLSGNLTSGEILEQIVHADRILAREWETRRLKQDVNARQLQLDLVRNVGEFLLSRNSNQAWKTFTDSLFCGNLKSVHGHGRTSG